MPVSRSRLRAVPGSLPRATGAVVVVLAAAAILLGIRPVGDRPQPAATLGPGFAATSVVVTSVNGLKAVAAAAGQPVYWAGPIPHHAFEVTQGPAGIVVRYVPQSPRAARDRARRLTIASKLSYQMFASVKAASKNPDAEVHRLPGGGLVVASRSQRTDAGFGYPRSNVAADVYDPMPGRALRLVMSGRIRPIDLRP